MKTAIPASYGLPRRREEATGPDAFTTRGRMGNQRDPTRAFPEG